MPDQEPAPGEPAPGRAERAGNAPREARRPEPQARQATPAFGDVLAACAAADAVSTPPHDEERRTAA
ncbi:hypothetical protein H3147_14455 [Streptomyces sp. OF8]|uniref:Uncharacterized protein n=2 Tax=Streptomyces alkaliterrae TaxID=2213162 RepID=A0A5P0YPG9_9ACTN|nr:hypothetical protein [Streptomyces alkaliterrae]MQS01497.1 hypothetical protein [Streptomyces alkaliterrae]